MKLFKKIDLKPVYICLGMIIIQAIIFMVLKIFQGEPHLIKGYLDNKIPFCSIFIIPYCIWYILVFFVPIYFYYNDKGAFVRYFICYGICSLCADLVFLIYPTEVLRPVFESSNVFNYITNIIYAVDDPPVNCLPSLHCAISMVFILTSLSSKKTSKLFKIFIIIISVLIMLSTLFIKQHVFIDFLTGITLAIYVYIFIINNNFLFNKIKNLLHL